MPNHRNPSLFLTQKQVDDIADRILEGKYSKRPVKPVDVFHAGFAGEGAYPREYIEARFRLTASGTTRRTNKFSSLIHDLARNANRSDPNAVWKVKRGWYSSNGHTYVMGPGGTEAERTMLKESAMLMWGWMWVVDKPGTTARDLELELAGFGGERERAFRLNGVLSELTERTDRKRQELVTLTKTVEEWDQKVEMVRDMVQLVNMQALDAQLSGV
jgi:hypothetical protein